jgi:hypothetical protein
MAVDRRYPGFRMARVYPKVGAPVAGNRPNKPFGADADDEWRARTQ